MADLGRQNHAKSKTLPLPLLSKVGPLFFLQDTSAVASFATVPFAPAEVCYAVVVLQPNFVETRLGILRFLCSPVHTAPASFACDLVLATM